MNDAIKFATERLRNRGFKYMAKYIEMFGYESLNPSYTKPCESAEKFYKDCVEEGHPYDWYFEFPDDAIF